MTVEEQLEYRLDALCALQERRLRDGGRSVRLARKNLIDYVLSLLPPGADTAKQPSACEFCGGSFPAGEPDGHGLGECVSVCPGCMGAGWVGDRDG